MHHPCELELSRGVYKFVLEWYEHLGAAHAKYEISERAQ